MTAFDRFSIKVVAGVGLCGAAIALSPLAGAAPLKTGGGACMYGAAGEVAAAPGAAPGAAAAAAPCAPAGAAVTDMAGVAGGKGAPTSSAPTGGPMPGQPLPPGPG